MDYSKFLLMQLIVYIFYIFIWQIFHVIHSFLKIFEFNLSPGKLIRKELVTVRSFLYVCCIFPATITTVAAFWTFYNINKELLFPQEVDKYVKAWENHFSHTLVALPLFLELWCSSSPILLPNHQRARLVVTIYGIGYQLGSVLNYNFLQCLCNNIFRVVYLYYKHGVWLYRFYGAFSGHYAILIAVVLQMLLNASFEVGYRLVAQLKASANEAFLKAHNKSV